MTSTKHLCLLTVLFVGVSLPGHQLTAVPGDRRAADREAIRNHIGQIFDAYIRGNREAIQAAHSQDWRGYISPSRQIIRGIDQYMQAADGVQKAARITAYDILDFDAVFYGDVAVVPYIARVSLDVGGAQIASKLRVLDVYARLNGDWIQIASNTSIHPDAQAAFEQQLFPISPGQKQALLAMREAVWRAYFTNDRTRLEQMLPAETLAINAGEEPWQNRSQVLTGAEQFAKSGGRLAKLDFPKTEVQMYGPIAVMYSEYVLGIEAGGKSATQSGRATEVFVNREGKWVNVGWHLDSGK